MSKVLDIYRRNLVELVKLREECGNQPLEDGETLDEAIARYKLHIHRLETNHKDCVEKCCMGCTMGGKNV